LGQYKYEHPHRDHRSQPIDRPNERSLNSFLFPIGSCVDRLNNRFDDPITKPPSTVQLHAAVSPPFANLTPDNPDRGFVNPALSLRSLI
jgi:hypothetical protein